MVFKNNKKNRDRKFYVRFLSSASSVGRKVLLGQYQLGTVLKRDQTDNIRVSGAETEAFTMFHLQSRELLMPD